MFVKIKRNKMCKVSKKKYLAQTRNRITKNYVKLFLQWLESRAALSPGLPLLLLFVFTAKEQFSFPGLMSLSLLPMILSLPMSTLLLTREAAPGRLSSGWADMERWQA